jgi:hypothetical protein
MQKIVLIACVGRKLQHQAPAKELYTSQLFKSSYRYAKTLQPDKIFILSAQHGLVHPDKIIAPYNKTLNTMPITLRKEWANQVKTDLMQQTQLEQDRFIFLAGKKYREHLTPHMKRYEVPLEGLGIGKQLKRLKELA